MTKFAPYDPATASAPLPRDILKEALQRSVAAKICAMLPADDESARHILALSRRLYDEFVSVEACSSSAEARS